MTPRSLFNIILKIIGILFIKEILAVLPQLLSVILIITEPGMLKEAFWTLFASLLILFVYCSFAWYLIFRSEYVIDQLKLDKGFNQESFPLNIHRSTVLSISIIVIGGLMVADVVPNLVWEINNYFKEKRYTNGMSDPNISYMLMDGAKLLIGLLLMGNQRAIVNFIERKRKSRVSNE